MTRCGQTHGNKMSGLLPRKNEIFSYNSLAGWANLKKTVNLKGGESSRKTPKNIKRQIYSMTLPPISLLGGGASKASGHLRRVPKTVVSVGHENPLPTCNGAIGGAYRHPLLSSRRSTRTRLSGADRTMRCLDDVR
jgi:hypothetical protein